MTYHEMKSQIPPHARSLDAPGTNYIQPDASTRTWVVIINARVDDAFATLDEALSHLATWRLSNGLTAEGSESHE